MGRASAPCRRCRRRRPRARTRDPVVACEPRSSSTDETVESEALPPSADDEPVSAVCPSVTAPTQAGRSREDASSASGQDDEVVAVDRPRGGALGQVARCGVRRRRAAGGRVAHQALGERRAVLVDDLDRVVGLEVALDPAHPAGSSDRPSVDERAPGAGVDDDPAGARPGRTRSTACGSSSRSCRGADGGADRLARRGRRDDTPGASAAAMTARTPDHAAILAAASLLAMPPLPRAVPAPPATASSAASTSTISSISDASASRRGSAVNRPAVSVSSTRRSARDQVRHERGQAVVVAVADLVVGDGVVLVHDGHARRGRAGAAASRARAGTASGARSRAA